MKKITSLILIFTLMTCFTSCSGDVANQHYQSEEIIENAQNVAENNIQATPTPEVENSVRTGQSQVTVGDNNTIITDITEPDITVSATNEPMVQGVFYRNVVGADISSDDLQIKEIDKKSDEMLKKIEDFPDTIKATGKTYYVSVDGKDSNDGLTPQSAKKTYMSFKSQLSSGDAVLFRRGDIFRGQQILVSGVSYGAYGTGIKPRFYGSVDGKRGKWTETNTAGVYVYSQPVQCCKIIFDNGKKISRPVYTMEKITRSPLNVYLDGSVIYLYCPDGNPQEVFKSIEISDNYHLVRGENDNASNIKIQNITFMYAGLSCLGGILENLEVEGCIFGYAGGTRLYTAEISVPMGNGIEFWHKAKNVNLHDNYIFQAFDAGITHQGPTPDTCSRYPNGVDYSNIHYENNLIEYCTYDIEVFSMRSKAAQDTMPDTANWDIGETYIKGNICRFTGWGWGSLDRRDKQVYSVLKYDACGEDGSVKQIAPLYVENNIFQGTRRYVFSIATVESNLNNMILKNNLFVTSKTARICNSVKATEDYEAALKSVFGIYQGNTFKILN